MACIVAPFWYCPLFLRLNDAARVFRLNCRLCVGANLAGGMIPPEIEAPVEPRAAAVHPCYRPKMSSSRRSFLISLSAAGAFRALAADEKDTVFSTDVHVVNVLATVRDRQGRIVKDL